MTTTATDAPTCPKCNGPMWDQKNGKFPWKPGTPIFKCRTKECATNGGVIWEPKGIRPEKVPIAPAPKPSFANRPEAELPEFLRDAEAQDKAELTAKLAPGVLDSLQTNLAIYQALTEWVTREIAPIYEKGIGWSPESATAAVATLFIQAVRK